MSALNKLVLLILLIVGLVVVSGAQEQGVADDYRLIPLTFQGQIENGWAYYVSLLIVEGGLSGIIDDIPLEPENFVGDYRLGRPLETEGGAYVLTDKGYKYPVDFFLQDPNSTATEPDEMLISRISAGIYSLAPGVRNVYPPIDLNSQADRYGPWGAVFMIPESMTPVQMIVPHQGEFELTVQDPRDPEFDILNIFGFSQIAPPLPQLPFSLRVDEFIDLTIVSAHFDMIPDHDEGYYGLYLELQYTNHDLSGNRSGPEILATLTAPREGLGIRKLFPAEIIGPGQTTVRYMSFPTISDYDVYLIVLPDTYGSQFYLSLAFGADGNYTQTQGFQIILPTEEELNAQKQT